MFPSEDFKKLLYFCGTFREIESRKKTKGTQLIIFELISLSHTTAGGKGLEGGAGRLNTHAHAARGRGVRNSYCSAIFC